MKSQVSTHTKRISQVPEIRPVVRSIHKSTLLMLMFCLINFYMVINIPKLYLLYLISLQIFSRWHSNLQSTNPMRSRAWNAFLVKKIGKDCPCFEDRKIKIGSSFRACLIQFSWLLRLHPYPDAAGYNTCETESQLGLISICICEVCHGTFRLL
jgi:hypothetical protein